MSGEKREEGYEGLPRDVAVSLKLMEQERQNVQLKRALGAILTAHAGLVHVPKETWDLAVDSSYEFWVREDGGNAVITIWQGDEDGMTRFRGSG